MEVFMSQKSFKENSNALYLVPTPIGNMKDMSPRLLEILNLCDMVLCEDTRITGSLLSYFNIKKKLICSNEQTEDSLKEEVEKYLNDGLNIALVTDRGTPIISDPGYKIVSYITEKGYNVVGLTGPTAFIPALIASGLNPQPFMFYGFLNSKESKRKKELELLRDYKYTIIFYEAPHRIIQMLSTVKDIFGNRRISVSREISKIFEEIYRGNIIDVISELEDSQIKGEFVIVVEGNREEYDYSEMTIDNHVRLYLDDGYTEKEAIKLVAKDRKVNKSEIYKYYHMKK